MPTSQAHICKQATVYQGLQLIQGHAVGELCGQGCVVVTISLERTILAFRAAT